VPVATRTGAFASAVTAFETAAAFAGFEVAPGLEIATRTITAFRAERLFKGTVAAPTAIFAGLEIATGFEIAARTITGITVAERLFERTVTAATIFARLEVTTAAAFAEGLFIRAITATGTIIAAFITAAFRTERLFEGTISAPGAIFTRLEATAVIAAFKSTAAACTERLFIGAITATGPVFTAFIAAASAAFGTVTIGLFEAPAAFSTAFEAAAAAFEATFAALGPGLVLATFSAAFSTGAAAFKALACGPIAFESFAKAAAAGTTLTFSTTAEFTGFGLELTLFL
jgi:hypothetical protein